MVSHGQSARTEKIRKKQRNLNSKGGIIRGIWPEEMELIYSGTQESIGRYIGYYGPYATSHDALDGDEKTQQEVRVSALSLASAVRAKRLF